MKVFLFQKNISVPQGKAILWRTTGQEICSSGFGWLLLVCFGSFHVVVVQLVVVILGCYCSNQTSLFVDICFSSFGTFLFEFWICCVVSLHVQFYVGVWFGPGVACFASYC